MSEGKPALAAMHDPAREATRRSSRALAFQVLYGLHFTPVHNEIELRQAYFSSPDVRDRLFKHHPDCAGNLPVLPAQPKGYAWDIVSGVWKTQTDLNQALSEVSHHWRLERIGKIELTILQIALFEMLNRPDVPPNVAINEAVALAKQFGNEDSKAFVNGILDNFAKSIKTGKTMPHWAKKENGATEENR